ncbi:MAG: flagellar motor protein MotB [Pseudomonadota bacterium]
MAFRRRRRIRQNMEQSNSGQMLNLALFIMLLAFFIVLNSLSSFEEIKLDKVRRSINITFSNDVQESMGSPTKSPLEEMREGHTFDRLDALFQAQIVSFEKQISKSTGRMNVQVDYDRFMDAVKAEGQIDIYRYPMRREVRDNFFLPTLASIIRSNIDGAPTRMEVVIHTKNNPAEMQNQNPDILKEKINIVGEVSRLFDRRGIPQKLINIGIEQGNPQIIDLYFVKYVPFSPIIDGQDVGDDQ